MSKKLTKAEIYKIRYKVYRDMGYSAKEARAMRSRSLDVSNIPIENGSINTNTKEYQEVKKVASSVPKKDVYVKSSKPSKKSRVKKSEVYRKRYQVYIDLGYTPEEARKLRSRKLNVNEIDIDKNGKVKKNKKYKELKKELQIDAYKNKAWSVDNETVFTRWGMLTKDDRYKDDTEKMVKYLMLKHDLSNDQAHYMLYMIVTTDMNYKEAQVQLLSKREFEMYDQRKASRQKLNRALKSKKEFETW